MAGETSQETLMFKVSNFNIVAAVLGGFLSLLGLVSYLLKEKFYLSEALISMLAGVVFSPRAANLIKPLEYAQGSQLTLDSITLYFTRLVLGVQLVLAGIQLPSRYLKIEWKPLSLLLGPGMCSMWITTSLLVWAMVPDFPFLHALAVGSCVTPTDPVLSNSIVKGRFADSNVPKELQKIIIAESGANDGLGYPFLFLALYLIKYTSLGGAGTEGGAARAMEYWFGITWGYTIIMSVLYGWLVGWIFKEALHWAEERNYVDRESFLVFAITLALFIVGTAGMLGSDDVLACFIAGNSFTWDDWFRLQTMDDSFQPTIDMLLNVTIFAWYGAIAPWHSFVDNSVIPIYRLIFLGVLVLIFRRLPFIVAVHKWIPQIEDWRQMLFMGYFGPIGVSAIFYLYSTLDFLNHIKVDGHERRDAERLEEGMMVIVWFLAICSIVAHGLSVPVGKLGLYLPRTMSRSRSSEDGDESNTLPFRIRKRFTISESAIPGTITPVRTRTEPARISRSRSPSHPPPLPLVAVGGSKIKESQNDLKSKAMVPRLRISSEVPDDQPTARVLSDRTPANDRRDGLLSPVSVDMNHSSPESASRPSTPIGRRIIKFPDEDTNVERSTKSDSE